MAIDDDFMDASRTQLLFSMVITEYQYLESLEISKGALPAIKAHRGLEGNMNHKMFIGLPCLSTVFVPP